MKSTGEILEDRVMSATSTGFSRTQAGSSSTPVQSVPGTSASTVVNGQVKREWLLGDEWSDDYYFREWRTEDDV